MRYLSLSVCCKRPYSDVASVAVCFLVISNWVLSTSPFFPFRQFEKRSPKMDSKKLCFRKKAL